MQMFGKLTVGVQVLRHLFRRPSKLRLLIEVGQHRLCLQVAVKVTTVLSEVIISPLFEVLTDGGHLFTTFNTAQWWHDATAAWLQREVETHALGHQGQIELPILFAIFGAHQVLSEVVADAARLTIVVLRRLDVVVVREWLWPDASFGRWIVT